MIAPNVNSAATRAMMLDTVVTIAAKAQTKTAGVIGFVATRTISPRQTCQALRTAPSVRARYIANKTPFISAIDQRFVPENSKKPHSVAIQRGKIML